jgi:hypothetical protein
MGLNNVLFDPDAVAGSRFPSTAVRQEIGDVAPMTIEPGTVTGDKLADGAVGTDQMANGAITAPKIANGGIATGNLADGAVTGAKIANGTINANNCGPGVISVTDIHGNSVLLTAVVCNSSDYTALTPKSPNTLYIVTS